MAIAPFAAGIAQVLTCQFAFWEYGGAIAKRDLGIACLGLK
jgi:hypothetical protein